LQAVQFGRTQAHTEEFTKVTNIIISYLKDTTHSEIIHNHNTNNTSIWTNNMKQSANSQPKRSHAVETKSNTNQFKDTAIILTKYLD
jgi:hypothetical protein